MNELYVFAAALVRQDCVSADFFRSNLYLPFIFTLVELLSSAQSLFFMFSCLTSSNLFCFAVARVLQETKYNFHSTFYILYYIFTFFLQVRMYRTYF